MELSIEDNSHKGKIGGGTTTRMSKLSIADNYYKVLE